MEIGRETGGGNLQDTSNAASPASSYAPQPAGCAGFVREPPCFERSKIIGFDVHETLGFFFIAESDARSGGSPDTLRYCDGIWLLPRRRRKSVSLDVGFRDIGMPLASIRDFMRAVGPRDIARTAGFRHRHYPPVLHVRDARTSSPPSGHGRDGFPPVAVRKPSGDYERFSNDLATLSFRSRRWWCFWLAGSSKPSIVPSSWKRRPGKVGGRA